MVQKILREDLTEEQKGQEKKRKNYSHMLEALDMKAQNLQREKELEQEEISKYMAYIEEKDSQASHLKEKKVEIDNAKEVIFLKLKEETEKKAEKQRALEELRNEL